MMRSANAKEALLNHSICIQLLKERKTPRNIFLHSRVVRAVSMLLFKRLSWAGEKADSHAIDMAALLHDIEKWQEIEHGYPLHTYGGYNTLLALGYPTIARIVLKHGLDVLLDGKYGLSSWEDIIVYYADKLVNDDMIVSLQERIGYLKGKYGKRSKQAMEKIIAVEKPLFALESQIFKKLGIKPGYITAESLAPYLIPDDY